MIDETPVSEPQAVPAEQEDPRDLEIQRLTDERDAAREQLLRAMAEAQNVQRRLRQQMEEDRKFAAYGLVEELLPVLDNFERTLAAAEKAASLETLVEGVRAVDRQLRRALERANVDRIEAQGQAYDPERHEALAVLESDEHPDETVVDEIEAGYTMHGRVVRPAKVRVTKRP